MDLSQLTPEAHKSYLKTTMLPLLQQHGITPKAMGWSSKEKQIIRFIKLLTICEPESTILDVGCGVGHLFEFMNRQGFKGQYLGIDALPEMIDQAKQNHPQGEFIVHDIMQDDINKLGKFDYVLASGIFGYANQNLLIKAVQNMFSVCIKGTAFNALSSWCNPNSTQEYYAEPGQILEACHKISPAVAFDHTYLEHDFTVYLFSSLTNNYANASPRL